MPSSNIEISLVKQLFDTIKCGVVMVDAETREIVYANNEAFVIIGCTEETLIGNQCTDYFCEQDLLYCPVLDEGQLLENYETFINRPDGSRVVISETINGLIYNHKKYLVESFIDITEIKKEEERVHSLLKISESKLSSEKEIALFALNEAVKLTDSKIGYLHLVSRNASNDLELSLFVWSSTEDGSPCIAEHMTHYPLKEAGIWADCVRTGKPAVHNDYINAPNKKGMPEGHFLVTRHLSVPVINGDDNIAAVMGVGNKENPYSKFDIEQLQLFANSTWQIIKRKRLDRDLLCSESRYKDLVEKAPAAIYEVDFSDPNLPIITADGAIEEMSGYTKEELLSMSSMRLLIPEDQKKFENRIKDVLAGKKIPPETEFRVITKHGHVRHSFLKANFRKREDGHIIAYVIAVDITNLKELEYKSQTYLQLVPSVFISLDDEANITFINNFGMDVLECDESVFGQNWFETFISEENRHEVREIFDNLLNGSVAFSAYENEIITRKGNLRIIAWRNTVLKNSTGVITNILSAGHNVTEQRIHEKKLDKQWEAEEARLKKHLRPLSLLTK